MPFVFRSYTGQSFAPFTIRSVVRRVYGQPLAATLKGDRLDFRAVACDIPDVVPPWVSVVARRPRAALPAPR